MVDTAMLPWEDSANPGFIPVLADDPTKRPDERRSLRRTNSFDEDVGPTIKSVPSFANYDYLTIDSDLTEEQLLLCSYYIYGYLMKNRKWGLFSPHSQQPFMLTGLRGPRCRDDLLPRV